jgi:BirA family biotin operon repressor/biotin-[acetyl-CoA-carboxylase] ligase
MKLNVERLQEGLRTKRLGKSILFSSQVESTNDLAKELATNGASEGTVVIAETQTCGRGRLGREWVSPFGGLWFSVILRPELKPSETVGLVFVAGLAVTEILHELYGLEAETKWPNDVLVNGKKICGVLAETKTTGKKVNYVIVGVGVNVNFDAAKVFAEEVRKTAVSVENVLGKKIELEELFKAVLEKLEEFYELFLREGFDSILKEWKKYAGFLSHQVEVTSGTEKLVGLALDIANNGSLILGLEDGTVKRVFVGDVVPRSK